MNFADIKEQIMERLSAAWTQFEESSIYSNLRERYENLSPRWQKLSTALGILVLALLLLLFPFTYFSSSWDFTDQFDERRTLIKELFRTNRAAEALKSAPQPVTGGELQSRLQTSLPTLRGVGPDQLGPVAPYDNASGGKAPTIVPKGVQQQGATVALKMLNLRQIVEVGYQLSSIDPSVKLVGMDIMATSPNPHYFDVVYKFVSFSIPFEPEPVANKGDKKSAKIPINKVEK